MPQYLNTNSDIFSVFQQDVNFPPVSVYSYILFWQISLAPRLYWRTERYYWKIWHAYGKTPQPEVIWHSLRQRSPKFSTLSECNTRIRTSYQSFKRRRKFLSPLDCIPNCAAVLKINIQLVTFDLRFSSIASPPVRLFEGHINSYTDNLVRTINANVLQVRTQMSFIGHCYRPWPRHPFRSRSRLSYPSLVTTDSRSTVTSSANMRLFNISLFSC